MGMSGVKTLDERVEAGRSKLMALDTELCIEFGPERWTKVRDYLLAAIILQQDVMTKALEDVVQGRIAEHVVTAAGKPFDS